MAQSLVQALEGLKFPCDRAHILEFAGEHDISPRAMNFLQRLPDQQYASMGELVGGLPSKGSLRKIRQEAHREPSPEPLPPQTAVVAFSEKESVIPEEPRDEEPEPDFPAMAGQADAPSIEPEPAAVSWRERQDPAMASLGQVDPFRLASQWQLAWLKSIESYTRVFMPWLHR